MNQCNVVHNLNASSSQEGFGGGFKENLIPRANYVSFTNNCCLQDDGVVDVATRRDQQRIRPDVFGRHTQEANVVENSTF